MTVCVVSMVSVLTLLVLGYSFDEQDGKIEQGGLLQMNTIPTGANATLDGELLGSQTQTKKTVNQGLHRVEYNLDGYRLWSKSIYIKPAQIGWVDYARLIPIELKPQTVRTLRNVDQAVDSPRRSYILLSQDSAKPVFELIDIRSDNLVYTTLELPKGDYTVPVNASKQKFEIVQWSDNENLVLIKHTYGNNSVEWILMDRSDADNSQNISKILKINPTSLEFAPGSDNILFAKTGKVVQRINVDSGDVSQPMAFDVQNYTVLDEDTIVYATFGTSEEMRTVEYISTDMKESRVLFTAEKDGQPLYGAMSRYFGKSYLAIVHGQVVTVYSGSFPKGGGQPEMTLLDAYELASIPLNFMISDNGRFVTAQLADGYMVYDIDLMKYDRTKWANKLKNQQPLHWLDNYMLWSDYAGKLVVYDFDGANQQTIMDVAEGLSAEISPNDKYMYGFYKSTKGYELRRVLLKL